MFSVSSCRYLVMWCRFFRLAACCTYKRVCPVDNSSEQRLISRITGQSEAHSCALMHPPVCVGFLPPSPSTHGQVLRALLGWSAGVTGGRCRPLQADSSPRTSQVTVGSNILLPRGSPDDTCKWQNKEGKRKHTPVRNESSHRLSDYFNLRKFRNPERFVWMAHFFQNKKEI